MPVAPATSRCGNLARSVTYTSLVIVLPIAIGSSAFDDWKASDDRILRMLTICGSLLGTSIPMVPLPGTGAMILIPSAARLSCRSSPRVFTERVRVPASGIISYRVIVGPTVASICEILTPKVFSVCVSRSLFSSCSSRSTWSVRCARFSSRSIEGKRKCDSSAVGS